MIAELPIISAREQLRRVMVILLVALILTMAVLGGVLWLFHFQENTSRPPLDGVISTQER